MKIKTKIPPGRFVCGAGPVKAEGKKAVPAFCYRIKRGGPKGHEKAMVEFHSKVSGKKIGYLSKTAKLPFADVAQSDTEFLESLELRIACEGGENRTDRNIAKHETLFSNEPVLAAGELCVRNGILEALNDKSGTYHTQNLALNEASLQRLVSLLSEAYPGISRANTLCAPDALRSTLESLPDSWPMQLMPARTR